MWKSLVCAIVALLGGSAFNVSAKIEENPPFPERLTSPLFKSDQLRLMAELDARPGNIDVDAVTGKVFFTFHPANMGPTPCKVCVLLEKFKGVEPFGDQSRYVSALAIRVGKKRDQVLILDHKNHGESKPTLYILDIESGNLLHEYTFEPSIAGKGSFLSDFVLSKDERYLFITDAGGEDASPGLITLDTKSWKASKFLVDDISTRQRKTPRGFAINNVTLDLPIKLGVNTVSISPKGDYLFYASTFDENMWKVPTKSLINGNRAASEVTEVSFPKAACDGSVIDEDTGLIYMTDVRNSAILLADPKVPGRAKTLVQSDKLLRWPDGLSISRGFLWITASAWHETFSSPPKDSSPYHILRVPLVMPQEPEGGAVKVVDGDAVIKTQESDGTGPESEGTGKLGPQKSCTA